jgi:hypothetical protein
MMCNDDISVSSHRELSCLQACHAVTVAGINEQTCMATCNTRGPEFKIGEFTYPAGKSCADRNNAGIAPRRQDNCEAGCAAGVQIAAASPASAAPQITRTRVGEFVGNDWGKVRNAIKACLGKFDTDPNCKINTWDMSKQTNLRMMAHGFASFNEYIGDWDVSNVFNFEAAFDGSGFNQDLSKWDMSKAEKVPYMFRNCPFNQPIDMWNIRSVWQAYKMFHRNTAFNQDISKLCDDRLAVGYSSGLFCKGGEAFL